MNHRDGLDRSTGGKRVQSRPPTFQLSWLLPSQLKLLPFSLVRFITISRSRSKLFRKPERYSPGRRPALLTVRNFCPPLFHCGSDFNRWISTHADIYWTPDDQPQTFRRIFSWSFSATNLITSRYFLWVFEILVCFIDLTFYLDETKKWSFY